MVLEEAGGELDREESEVNTQHNCLKRLKRRKKESSPSLRVYIKLPGEQSITECLNPEAHHLLK